MRARGSRVGVTHNCLKPHPCADAGVGASSLEATTGMPQSLQGRTGPRHSCTRMVPSGCQFGWTKVYLFLVTWKRIFSGVSMRVS